jgi:tripartite-type tricarboxylate transporter receptor subunit TctC
VVPSARRSIAVFLMLAASAPTLQAAGEEWPARPVRLIIPFPPGGSNDIIGRMMGLHLGERLGKSVVVDNRSGAGGNLGIDLVAKAEPDGYTMLIVSAAFAFGPSMYQKLPFDPVKSFAPVAKIGNGPNVVSVFPGLPVKSAKDLIALAKAKPGQLNFSSSGTGTIVHLSGELFTRMAGVQMQHVPYKGTALAAADIKSGQIAMMVDNIVSALPFMKSGLIKGVAMTSAKRSGVLPDLPTVAESGVPGYESVAYFAIFAPAGTPAGVVRRLNGELVKIVNTPQVKARLIELGADPVGSTPEALAEVRRAEQLKWAKVIQEAGVKPQ